MHGPPESQREPHGRVSGASVGNHGAELCYGNRWLNPRTDRPREPRAPGERRLGALFSAFCSRNFSFFFFLFLLPPALSPAAKTLRQRPRCFGETRHACAGMSDAGRCAQYNTAHSPSKTISRRLPTAVSCGGKRRRVRSEERNKRKKKHRR